MDKVISDTTMMFMACACYSLYKRNEFGKKRLMQFMADVIEVNNKTEYTEIQKFLENELKIEFPQIER